ncbi:MAG TPA: ribosomal protein S18-alanine N-acetyltransferase [Rhizomicrobium sp.]|nr:ribosomal protein S18-alanine N-acetyltransferase [Rhizomicrobium sp.]
MIRAATVADLAVMAGLHAQCFAEGWSAASLGELLASGGTFGFVFAEEAAPAGFVLARVAAQEAEILTLAVAPGARRKGLGGLLMEAAAARARASGARAMFLEVGADNMAARALYRRLGFTEAGRRKGYYAAGAGGGALDALVLKAELPLSPLGNRPRLD